MSYYNDYDESVTLEEAMDYIDECLTEKGAFGKWLDIRENKIEKLKKEIKDIERRLETVDGPGKLRLKELLRKKYYEIEKLRDEILPGSGVASVNNSLDTRYELNHGAFRGESDKEYMRRNKRKFNQATGGPTRKRDTDRPSGDRGRQTIPESLIRANAQKKAKKQTTQESVNDLRLQVFEAYESGAISEDEKYTFLDYLNLDNYE